MPLLKLNPEQIMSYWDEIKISIAAALPPYVYYSDDSMLGVQEQLLLGSLECWVSVEHARAYSNPPPRVYGTATTRVVVDETTGTKNLLVFSVCIAEEHPQSIWRESIDQLRIYARSKNCSKIIAYSDNPHMIYLCEKLGANTAMRFISFEI